MSVLLLNIVTNVIGWIRPETDGEIVWRILGVNARGKCTFTNVKTFVRYDVETVTFNRTR